MKQTEIDFNINAIEVIPLSKIKLNPDNPRTITNDKFKKLVKSIKEFPQMLGLRPIIINSDFMCLGGNMRTLAAKEAGLKVVPIIHNSELTEAQQKEFIIKDNVGFGVWDWDIIANEWEKDQVIEWGLELRDWSDVNNLTEDDLDFSEEFDAIGDSSNLQRVVFIFDSEINAEKYLKALKVDYKKRNMAWQVNLTTDIQ